MKAAFKKISLLCSCIFALSSCQWATVTVRHIFFEYRFNLSEVYATWINDEGVEEGGSLGNDYFRVPLKTTYLDLHSPIQTDDDLAPRFGAFEFQFDQVDHSLIQTKGVYYGLANPHAPHGKFYFTFDDLNGLQFSSFHNDVDPDDTRKGDDNYADVASRTFCFNYPDYYLIQGNISNFLLKNGKYASIQLTFKSERWGG
jgi:hypothetical protein